MSDLKKLHYALHDAEIEIADLKEENERVTAARDALQINEARMLEENERLRGEQQRGDTLSKLCDELKEENERLQAETFAAELRQKNAEDEVKELRARHRTDGPTRRQLIARIEAALHVYLECCTSVDLVTMNEEWKVAFREIGKALRGEG